MAPKREVLDVTAGRCITADLSLLMAKTSTTSILCTSMPVDGAPELPVPAEEFLTLGISMYRKSLFLLH
jgi:hypothetical protein